MVIGLRVVRVSWLCAARACAVVDGGENRIEVTPVTALQRAKQKGRLIAALFIRESDLASKRYAYGQSLRLSQDPSPRQADHPWSSVCGLYGFPGSVLHTRAPSLVEPKALLNVSLEAAGTWRVWRADAGVIWANDPTISKAPRADMIVLCIFVSVEFCAAGERRANWKSVEHRSR